MATAGSVAAPLPSEYSNAHRTSKYSVAPFATLNCAMPSELTLKSHVPTPQHGPEAPPELGVLRTASTLFAPTVATD